MATTRIQLGAGAGLGGIVACANVQTTQTGTDAATTEKTLATYTIPANTFDPGASNVIRVTAYGGTAANANVKTIRLKFGSSGTLIAPSGAFNDCVWVIEAIIAGNSTAQVALLSSRVSTAATAVAIIDTVTIGLVQDGTTDLDLIITGQNGTAAANDIVFSAIVVEYLSSVS